MFQLHSSWRERSGQLQPPAERSPVLSLEQTEYHQAAGIRRSTRYQVPVVRVCTGLFAFAVNFVLHLGPIAHVLLLLYCRSERDIANMQHSTDRAISSARVISNR